MNTTSHQTSNSNRTEEKEQEQILHPIPSQKTRQGFCNSQCFQLFQICQEIFWNGSKSTFNSWKLYFHVPQLRCFLGELHIFFNIFVGYFYLKRVFCWNSNIYNLVFNKQIRSSLIDSDFWIYYILFSNSICLILCYWFITCIYEYLCILLSSLLCLFFHSL